MTTRLSEDDLYRTSTQFRLWSFSPEQLAARRRKTHELALARARQYASQRSQNEATLPECLTAEEELRLVQRYCELVRTTSDHLKWPTNVTATAVQYLKRFYLSNSCMTYPPKEIYKTALFLASKTEAIHWTVPKFASSISADPDAILAPEYKVMQALRFTLDVRQPVRGSKGVLMELLNMAEGKVGTANAAKAKSGQEIQHELLALKRPSVGCKTTWKTTTDNNTVSIKQLKERIEAAVGAARILLDGPASISDAYFLYTPAQILLAALQLADEPLTSFFLDTKIPVTSAMRSKILATVQACAEMLAAFGTQGGMTKDERAALEKKLDLCRDPTTKDLVKSHAAMKRGGTEDGKMTEQEAKRRKLQREKSNQEMNDLFGPSLGTEKATGNG